MYRCCATNGRRYILVIAMVSIPALPLIYSLTNLNDSIIAICIGTVTSAVGAYLSYFFNGATGRYRHNANRPFLLAFLFAPKHGMLAARRRARQSSCSISQSQHPKDVTQQEEVQL